MKFSKNEDPPQELSGNSYFLALGKCNQFEDSNYLFKSYGLSGASDVLLTYCKVTEQDIKQCST